MKRKNSVYDKIRPYLYLAPALVSMAFLTFWPIIQTILVSFQNRSWFHTSWHPKKPKNLISWVGFQNYISILTGDFKPTFIPVFIWTVVFAACTCLVGYLLGLLLALLLNNDNMKERGIYKAILVLPWALPGTIAALSWQGLLNAEYGGINKLLKSLHLINTNIQWIISTPALAKFSIIVVSVWFTVPFMMNTCLGALTAIPVDYYEAANIDGATKWQKFTKITLPSLASSSYPLVISSFSMNFNNFGAVYMITQGDPPRLDTAYAGSTDILISAAYKMVGNQGRYDLASALAVLVFLIIGTISFIQMKASGQFEEVN